MKKITIGIDSCDEYQSVFKCPYTSTPNGEQCIINGQTHVYCKALARRIVCSPEQPIHYDCQLEEHEPEEK